MRRLDLTLRLVLVAHAAVAVAPRIAAAAPIDAVTARAQLKEGYALKKDGKCAEAMPHLLESERLDPQSKTLLNLAECEDALGHLVDADAHLVEARDRARSEGRAELATIAEQRLALVDGRLPRLTIVLDPGATSSVQVERDGSVLGAASIGVALPVDPGPHAVVARDGAAARRFEVTMREGETRTLAVSPTEGGSAAPPVAPSPSPGDGGSASSPSESHLPALVALGVGVAGLAVGTVFGVRSFGQWRDAHQECVVSCGPDSSAQSSLADARAAATAADVGFVVGGVGVASGVVLWILESRAAPGGESARSVWIDPRMGTTGASVTCGGRF